MFLFKFVKLLCLLGMTYSSVILFAFIGVSSYLNETAEINKTVNHINFNHSFQAAPNQFEIAIEKLQSSFNNKLDSHVLIMDSGFSLTVHKTQSICLYASLKTFNDNSYTKNSRAPPRFS